VLIALGILAIGSVAIASLFPTAAYLQKEAVNTTLRQNHVRSADAVLEGVGLDNTTLLEFIELMSSPANATGHPAYDVRNPDIDDIGYDVFALAEIDITIDSSFDEPPVTPVADAGGTPDMRMGGAKEYEDSMLYDRDPSPTNIVPNFNVAFRSLPSIQPQTGAGFADRELFWVPLVRAGLEASELYPDWNVYVFILQPNSKDRSAGVYDLGNYPAFDTADIVCANPDAAADYFPKVFRVPVDWDDDEPFLIDPDIDLTGYVKAGDKVLGDNGKIYRVSQFEPGGTRIILSEDGLYSPINDRDLGAVWVAPAPGGAGQDSPLADIKLLSNTVVRTNDY
jgi:hypothetical protein